MGTRAPQMLSPTSLSYLDRLHTGLTPQRRQPFVHHAHCNPKRRIRSKAAQQLVATHDMLKVRSQKRCVVVQEQDQKVKRRLKGKTTVDLGLVEKERVRVAGRATHNAHKARPQKRQSPA